MKYSSSTTGKLDGVKRFLWGIVFKGVLFVGSLRLILKKRNRQEVSNTTNKHVDDKVTINNESGESLESFIKGISQLEALLRKKDPQNQLIVFDGLEVGSREWIEARKVRIQSLAELPSFDESNSEHTKIAASAYFRLLKEQLKEE